MHILNRLSLKQYILISIALIAIFAMILFAMGRVPICKCGYVKLWQSEVYSSENSQHISDWYSFSHIIHGFAFYGIMYWVAPEWPIGLRLVSAIIAETGWEVLENSPLIINRYRSETISLDYFGDSIINSMFDVLFMVFGFWIARRFSWSSIIILTIIMELFVGYMIRDNLTLNIIMLIYPIKAIKIWQMGV